METREASYVQSAAGRISTNYLGDRSGDAHASHAGDEPGPDGGARAAGGKREAEGRGDAREQATDAHGEGEGGQVAELALEYLVFHVSK